MLITVKDCICGHGKTLGMVKQIKEMYKKNANEVFLYITPYLEQCHDVAGTEPIDGDEYKRPKRDKHNAVIYSPSDKNLGCMYFKHPNNNNSLGAKQEGLKTLMSNKDHIVSTHNLFLNMKLDTLQNADQYTLIIDECLDVFDKYALLPEKEVKKLLKLNILHLQEDGISLSFNRKKFGDMCNLSDGEDAVADTRYEELAVLCDNNQILLVNGSVLLWEFSAEILKKFKKVFILSYLFEGREMSVYLKKHKLEYEIVKEGKKGSDIAHLVEVLDDSKLNSIGSGYFDLSISRTRTNRPKRYEPNINDFKDNEVKYKASVKRYESYLNSVNVSELQAHEVNDTLRKNLHSVFTTRWKAKANDRYFTCLSENKSLIGGKNYHNNWLGYSTKAVNSFSDTHHVAFLMNVFIQPYIKQVCDGTDFVVDEDLVSLSHLVQFVFRSALRKGEAIKVYIPSSRMRELFKDYLEGVYE